jgi:hypothetical protein
MLLSFIKSQKKLIFIVLLFIFFTVIYRFTDQSQMPTFPIPNYWNLIIRYVKNIFFYLSDIALIGTSSVLFVNYAIFAFHNYKK